MMDDVECTGVSTCGPPCQQGPDHRETPVVGVSPREARARNIMGGRTPTTAWQSSGSDAPGTTHIVFLRHAMLDGGMSDPARDPMAGHSYHASCSNEADHSHRACIPGVCGVRSMLHHAVLHDLHSPMIDYLAAIDYIQFSAPVSLPLPQAGSGAGPRPRRASRTWQQRIARSVDAWPTALGQRHRPSRRPPRGWRGPRPQGTSPQGPAAETSRTVARPAPTVGALLPPARLLPGAFSATLPSGARGRRAERAAPAPFVCAQNHGAPCGPCPRRTSASWPWQGASAFPVPLRSTPPADACGRRVHEEQGAGGVGRTAGRRGLGTGDTRERRRCGIGPLQPGISSDTCGMRERTLGLGPTPLPSACSRMRRLHTCSPPSPRACGGRAGIDGDHGRGRAGPSSPGSTATAPPCVRGPDERWPCAARAREDPALHLFARARAA
jgi:hypothetical protein